MNKNKKFSKTYSILAGLLALCFSSCSTNMAPPEKTNPAPQMAFNSATNFQLSPVSVPTDIREREPEVSNWIQDKVDASVKPIINNWNAVGRRKSGPKLLITPRVEELKFISTGERIFAGAFAGGSAIIMRLEVKDLKSQQVIANPKFYQHANAFGGAYSYGSTDRDMLDRVIGKMAGYLNANYESAVGGDTGVE